MTEEKLIHSLYPARELSEDTLIKILALLKGSKVYRDLNVSKPAYHFVEHKKDGNS